MAEQRLIDAEALKNKFEEKINRLKRDMLRENDISIFSKIKLKWLKDFLELINNAPTIDAKPVVHAHWKEWYPPKEFVLTGEKRLFICSCCDAKFETVENSRYCPYCGAQMDESIS